MATNPFLKQNKKAEEPIKIIVSENFVDEEGNPVPFVLQIISSKEADKLSDSCMEPVIDPKTRRKIGQEINQKRLQEALLVKSIIEPNLEDKDLLESWGVKTPTDLLSEMLNVKERAILLKEFDKHFQSSEEESEESEKETKNA